MMTKAWRAGLLSSAALIAMAAAPVTKAQAQAAPAATAAEPDQLSDVVVTAQRRNERLQDVPVSVVAVSNAALERARIENVADLHRLVPSLVVTQGITVMQPFLRGVGSLTATPGNEASIPIYVDGIYYARLPQALLEFNNVERVEVLKGPQGTLFGRNATGGLVQIVTKDPSSTPSLKLTGGYGNYDTTRATFYGTSGVLGDKVTADLSLSYKHQGDGWGQNVTTHQDIYKENFFAARTKWNFELSPTLLFKLSADYVYTNTSVGLIGAPYRGTTQGNPVGLPSVIFPSLPGFYDLRASINPYEHENIYGISGRLEKDLGFAKLISISAYRIGKTDVYNDTDYVPIDWTGSDQVNKYNQVSEELQLASKSGGRLEWVGGLYFLRSIDGAVANNFGLSANGINSAFFGQQTAKSYAAYGQATYKILPDTSLTGGLRYTYDDISARGRTDLQTTTTNTIGTLTTASKSFDKLTWKVSLDHKFNDDFMVYATQSRGYKSGLFPTILFRPTPVNPEVLDAYEVGFKSELFDRRLRLNASAFLYNAKDLQLSSRNGLVVVLFNAANARMKGIDFDGEFLITHGLSATFGVSLLDAKFLKFPNAPTTRPNSQLANGTIPVPGCTGLPATNTNPINGGNVGYCAEDASGNRLTRAPKITANFGLNYKIPTSIGVWEVAGDVSYNDGFYWFVDDSLKQPAYTLVSGSVRYTMQDGRHWISLWAKNITDKKYYLYAQQNQGPAAYPAAPAEPRTFGFTVGADF